MLFWSILMLCIYLDYSQTNNITPPLTTKAVEEFTALTNEDIAQAKPLATKEAEDAQAADIKAELVAKAQDEESALLRKPRLRLLKTVHTKSKGAEIM